MDKSTALKILGLDPDATRKEAQKAFRVLAKNCHPDRFARDRAGAEKAEARMKDINGAFHYLSPLLPPDKEPVQPGPISPKRDKPVNRWQFFSLVQEKWKKRARSKSVPGRETNRSWPKRPVQMKQKTGSAGAPQFDTLLKNLAPDTKPRPIKTAQSLGTDQPYENYCRHMAVKKKIKGARNRSKNMGRVEKISPVRPVNSIDGK